MTHLPEALTRASQHDVTVHRPEFFRLSSGPDRERMAALLEREPRTVVFDQLHSQLTELVRSLNPSVRFAKEELDAAVQAHLMGVPAAEYGVWVYYPWSFRLVHLLDEAEFALVRTDRNRNKITREEQAILATKKVGVIGLSVGQSVSLTMALERSFGEIRLADFDTLELSNLNRIRSGVHEMGVPKVINTAREIAELDPFLKVTCFLDGVTKENIDRFFVEGGKLDMLVEECDSVDIKIIARQKAKSLRIPVVMDTSDRGLIDVERFDLEPDRPMLHGLLEGLDLSVVERQMTNQEKLPFMGKIVGLETISTRMKDSLPELGRTILTWPQLASGVVLGGALVSDVHRRIMTGDFTASGRWWMDIEEHLQAPTQTDPR
jgi:molybdopterin/thiamine biosynthesis adenylyltransferase